MLEEAEKSFLTEEGLCPKCNQWLELEPDKGYLPKHKHQGEKCSNGHYSPSKYRYLVKTTEEAAQLAKMIAEDDGTCLSGVGCGGHNMACGDGSRCWSTRFNLAKALANFVLKNSEEKKTDD